MFCTDDAKFSSYLLEVSGITSACALIPAIACVYSIVIVLRQVHVNLKRLMYIESVLYLLRPIIQTIEIFYVCNDDTVNSSNDSMMLALHIARDFIVVMNRSIWIEVGVERLIATIYVRNYEKARRAKHVLWVFIPFSLFMSAIYTFYVEFIENNFVVIYTFLMVTALIAVVMFWVIRRKNEQLRRISNLSGVALTEKYQIVENLRSLDYLIPHANIDGITDLITVILGLLMRIFVDAKSGAAMYHLCLNFQILVFAMYWTRRNPQLRKMFRQIHARAVGPATGFTMDTEPRQDRNYIRNALGVKIQKFQTAEEHFHAMKNAWN